MLHVDLPHSSPIQLFKVGLPTKEEARGSSVVESLLSARPVFHTGPRLIHLASVVRPWADRPIERGALVTTSTTRRWPSAMAAALLTEWLISTPSDIR